MTETTAERAIAEYRDLALREGLKVFEPARHGENNADGAVRYVELLYAARDRAGVL